MEKHEPGYAEFKAIRSTFSGSVALFVTLCIAVLGGFFGSGIDFQDLSLLSFLLTVLFFLVLFVGAIVSSSFFKNAGEMKKEKEIRMTRSTKTRR